MSKKGKTPRLADWKVCLWPINGHDSEILTVRAWTPAHFRVLVVPGHALGVVSDEVVQDALRILVRDELDAAMVRAGKAAVADDDMPAPPEAQP